MEFKLYLKPFKKHFLFIIFLSFLGALVAFVLTSAVSGWRVEQLFYLATKATPPEATEAAFFNLENARNFTDTSVALAEKELTTLSARDITVRKVAPQLIRVSLTTADSETALSQIKKVPELLNPQVASLTNGTLTLSPIADPQITQTRLNKVIVSVFGFMIGTIFAIFTIGLAIYFKV